jgi:hypothetical protein
MKMQELHTSWTMQMSALVGDDWSNYSGLLFYEVSVEPDEYQEPVKPNNAPIWESADSGDSVATGADAWTPLIPAEVSRAIVRSVGRTAGHVAEEMVNRAIPAWMPRQPAKAIASGARDVVRGGVERFISSRTAPDVLQRTQAMRGASSTTWNRRSRVETPEPRHRAPAEEAPEPSAPPADSSESDEADRTADAFFTALHSYFDGLEEFEPEVEAFIQSKECDELTPQEIAENAAEVWEAKRAEAANWSQHGCYRPVPAEEAQSRPITARWVIRWKLKDGRRVIKARLCVRGFQDEQKSELYTFAEVAAHRSQLLLCQTAVQRGWSIKSVDVPCAFLQGSTFEKVAPERRACFIPPKDLWQFVRMETGEPFGKKEHESLCSNS